MRDKKVLRTSKHVSFSSDALVKTRSRDDRREVEG